jgi:hypothetical protein
MRRCRRIRRKVLETVPMDMEKRWLTLWRRASTAGVEGSEFAAVVSSGSSMLPVYQEIHQSRLTKMIMEPR